MLGLPILKENSNIEKQSQDDWITKGIRFPAGTDFRVLYKGKFYTGKVEGGALIVNGTSYDSPSSAATAITKNSVNGWRFWEVKLPNESNWKSLRLFSRQGK